MKLHVIQGAAPAETPANKAYRKAAKVAPGALLECHRCGGHEVIETKIGMRIRDGKPYGGTKTYLCAACHRKGERVVLA